MQPCIVAVELKWEHQEPQAIKFALKEPISRKMLIESMLELNALDVGSGASRMCQSSGNNPC